MYYSLSETGGVARNFHPADVALRSEYTGQYLTHSINSTVFNAQY